MDISILSKELLPNVKYFSVNQNAALPSDHAPVTITLYFPVSCIDIKQLVSSSEELGNYNAPPDKKSLCTKPIPYKRIHEVRLTHMLADTEPPDTNDLGSVEKIAEEFNDILYNCIKESVRRTSKPITTKMAAYITV